MTAREREQLQILLSSLIGLELWRIGESELPKTAEDDWMRLRARLLVYEAMLFPKKDNDVKCQDDSPDDVPF